MRVFVTGATGFVGSAIVDELLANDHEVIGLARSDQSAAHLAAIGGAVHRGDLNDIESLRAGALAADAVIHTAFLHDFAQFAASCELDRNAIEALGSALEGTEKPLLVSAGIAFLPTAERVATEDDAAPRPVEAYPRASETAAAALADRGIKASVMRLPPSVHGAGDHGFVPILISIARDTGVSAYVDDGSNHWSAVHRNDAARAYRLAIERGGRGETFHAVGEEGVAFREIAETIAEGIDVDCQALDRDAANDHFTWFGRFACLDQPASSAKTRQRLGWAPTGPGLLRDMQSEGYFDA